MDADGEEKYCACVRSSCSTVVMATLELTLAALLSPSSLCPVKSGLGQWKIHIVAIINKITNFKST